MEDSTRRDFLKTLVALPLAGAIGCSLFEDSELRVGTLKELKTKGYLTPDFNGDRIFVKLVEGKPVCYSLVCTHKQCTVKWKPEEAQFLCPCHKGRYDAEGMVVSGKPKKALNRFKVELRGEEVWVLNEVL